MHLNGPDSLWTCQVHPVGTSTTNGNMGEDSPPMKPQVWTGVWSHIMKLDSGYSNQRLFCSLCSLRVELIAIVKLTREFQDQETQGVSLPYFVQPPRDPAPPLQMGFMTPQLSHWLLASSFSVTSSSCLIWVFMWALSARHRARLWVVTACV